MKTYSKLKLLIHPRDCERNLAPGSQAHVSRLSCQFPDPGLFPPAWVSPPRDRTASLESPALAGRFFTTVPPGKAPLLHYKHSRICLMNEWIRCFLLGISMLILICVHLGKKSHFDCKMKMLLSVRASILTFLLAILNVCCDDKTNPDFKKH